MLLSGAMINLNAEQEEALGEQLRLPEAISIKEVIKEL